jgi:hypothetical protein
VYTFIVPVPEPGVESKGFHRGAIIPSGRSEVPVSGAGRVIGVAGQLLMSPEYWKASHPFSHKNIRV